MTDFLDRVVARAGGVQRAVQPLTASRYAPPSQNLVAAEKGVGADSEVSGPDATGAQPSAAGGALTAPEVAGEPEHEHMHEYMHDAQPSLATSVSLEAPVPAAEQDTPRPASPAVRGLPGVFETAPRDESAGAGDGAPERRPETRPDVRSTGRPSPAVAAHTIARKAASQPVAARTGTLPAPGAASVSPEPDLGADVGAARSVAGARPGMAPSEAAAAPGALSPVTSSKRSQMLAEREDAFWKFLYGTADPERSQRPGEGDGEGQGEKGSAEPTMGSSTLARGDDGRSGEGRRGDLQRLAEERGPAEIVVAIDRIDVRGLAAPPPPAERVRRTPRLTLAEYMHKQGPARR